MNPCSFCLCSVCKNLICLLALYCENVSWQTAALSSTDEPTWKLFSFIQHLDSYCSSSVSCCPKTKFTSQYIYVVGFFFFKRILVYALSKNQMHTKWHSEKATRLKSIFSHHSLLIFFSTLSILMKLIEHKKICYHYKWISVCFKHIGSK